MRLISCLLVAGFVQTVSGCANFKTVHRNLDLGNSTTSKSVAIDGYQLPIFSHMPYVRPDGITVDANGNKQVFIVCPNPPVEAISANSVAAAVTNSFKAGQASRSGLGGQIDTQASVASAMAAASIGLRTNSTTLLSYNATSNCLAYMGGATQDRKFMELARRNQQITLAILAIEQLTGVAQAGQASFNSESGSSTGTADLAPLQTALDNRAKEDIAARAILATAEANVKSSKDDLQTKLSDLAKANAALEKLVDAKEKNEAIEAQRAVVASSQQAVTNAQKIMDTARLVEATARQDAARTAANVSYAKTAIELAQSNVRAQALATTAAGQGQGPRASATSDVANAVVEIVKNITSAIGTGETCASLRDTLITGTQEQFNRLTGKGGRALLAACAVAEGTSADPIADLTGASDAEVPSPPPAIVPSKPAAASASRAPNSGKVSSTSTRSNAVKELYKQSFEGFIDDAKKSEKSTPPVEGKK